MRGAFTLSLEDGSILVEGSSVKIAAGATRAAVVSALGSFYTGNLDQKNGYEWVYLQGLFFGGAASGMSLCFHDGLLREVNWSVTLPDSELDGGWPTQEAIDAEIAFVRATLAQTSDHKFATGQERFPWGAVWSVFDSKGFTASSGLRYKA